MVVKADEESTTEGIKYNSEDEDDEDDKDKDEDSEKEENEFFYFFDCIGCKNTFREKANLYKHIKTIMICRLPMIAYDACCLWLPVIRSFSKLSKLFLV